MPLHPALLNFEGYGGRARIIFIGVEERNPGNDVENLVKREKFSARMDLRCACNALFGSDWWTSVSRTRQPVWTTAAKIVNELGGLPSWMHVRDEVLGRKNSETLLTELLPVPLDKSAQWPELFRDRFGFHRHSEYLAAMIGARQTPGPRVQLLRQLISAESVDYVFCYGTTNIRRFKQLFPDVGQWHTISSCPVGYSPQKFHVARQGRRRIAITRHYSARRNRPFGTPDIPALLAALS